MPDSSRASRAARRMHATSPGSKWPPNWNQAFALRCRVSSTWSPPGSSTTQDAVTCAGGPAFATRRGGRPGGPGSRAAAGPGRRRARPSPSARPWPARAAAVDAVTTAGVPGRSRGAEVPDAAEPEAAAVRHASVVLAAQQAVERGIHLVGLRAGRPLDVAQRVVEVGGARRQVGVRPGAVAGGWGRRGPPAPPRGSRRRAAGVAAARARPAAERLLGRPAGGPAAAHGLAERGGRAAGGRGWPGRRRRRPSPRPGRGRSRAGPARPAAPGVCSGANSRPCSACMRGRVGRGRPS